MPYCNRCGSKIPEGLYCEACAAQPQPAQEEPAECRNPAAGETRFGAPQNPAPSDTAPRTTAGVDENGTTEQRRGQEAPQSAQDAGNRQGGGKGESHRSFVFSGRRGFRPRLTPVRDLTDRFDPDTVTRDTGAALLCYLGPLCLIPFFCGRSRYVRFHTNQGLLVLLAELLTALFAGMTCLLQNAIKPIAPLFATIGELCGLLSLVWCVWGIVHVIRHRAAELPLIGSYRLIAAD